MELMKEGDRGEALSRKGLRVVVEYRYQALELEHGERIPDVLVGVDPTTKRVMSIPAQSMPRIQAAQKENKAETLSVRIPFELEDALLLVSAELDAGPRGFIPALVRLYLVEALHDPDLVRRLTTLSAHPLALQSRRAGLAIRIDAGLHARVRTLATREGITTSDLVRGIALAAFEDVFERRSSEMKGMLEAVAKAG